MAKKLSFNSLPRKPIEHHPGLSRPPIQTLAASIPFQWEEVPAKRKKPCCFTPKEAADLPPRLLNEANMDAPIFDGPFSESFSGYQNNKERVVLGSGRFRSSRRAKNTKRSWNLNLIRHQFFYDCNDDGGVAIETTKVKRRSRFWSFSIQRHIYGKKFMKVLRR